MEKIILIRELKIIKNNLRAHTERSVTSGLICVREMYAIQIFHSGSHPAQLTNVIISKKSMNIPTINLLTAANSSFRPVSTDFNDRINSDFIF